MLVVKLAVGLRWNNNNTKVPVCRHRHSVRRRMPPVRSSGKLSQHLAKQNSACFIGVVSGKGKNKAR